LPATSTTRVTMARRMGRRKERRLFTATGGRPENTELLYSNELLDAKTKERYRQFLAERLKTAAPSQVDEEKNPKEAADFYRRCYTYLRENTRDTERFKLLFQENVSYGYRRNLLGLKPFGIGLNLLTAAVAVALFYYHPNFASLTEGKLAFLGLLAVIHLLYFVFGVTKASVIDASRTCARQLTLSCETLMS
jgi:hypothetical protein